MNAGIGRIFEEIFTPVAAGRGSEQLREVAERFAAIPYENITKIIRASERTDPDLRMRTPRELLEDHRKYGTGGTCFSLTHCLRVILESYGYGCAVHMADLSGGRNNHCAVTVEMNGRRFLIDPGYLITTPLPLPESGDRLHPTRLHPVRIERDAGCDAFHLSTLEPDGEKYRYRLKGAACPEPEFRRFWIDSFSWTMMNSLLVTRAVPNGRIYLHDRYVRMTGSGGRETGKIRDHLDDEIAVKTGISAELVRRARRILARDKRSLLDPGER